jgi:hypothetical protein
MIKLKRNTFFLYTAALLSSTAFAIGLVKLGSTSEKTDSVHQSESAKTVISLCNKTPRSLAALYSFPEGDNRIKGRLTIATGKCTKSSPVLYKGGSYKGIVTFYLQGIGSAQRDVALGSNCFQFLQESNQHFHLNSISSCKGF